MSTPRRRAPRGHMPTLVGAVPGNGWTRSRVLRRPVPIEGQPSDDRQARRRARRPLNGICLTSTRRSPATGGSRAISIGDADTLVEFEPSSSAHRPGIGSTSACSRARDRLVRRDRSVLGDAAPAVRACSAPTTLRCVEAMTACDVLIAARRTSRSAASSYRRPNGSRSSAIAQRGTLLRASRGCRSPISR